MKLEDIGFYTLSDARASKASHLSPMKRCEMIITEQCNFRCPYCRGLDKSIYGNREKKELKLNQIVRNIDYWCDRGELENIRFSGGEPTMHPKLKAAVLVARLRGIKRIAISTNGSGSIFDYMELIHLGVNDISISLDACCAEDGDKMAGGIKGSWEKVVFNIKNLARFTYLTVGVVLTPNNVKKCIDTIKLAHKLGVDDIRIISAAQWNKPIEGLENLGKRILNAHPILKYRVNRILNGENVRGIKETDSNKCGLMLDDSIIAGNYFFPCVIYMREGGKPIGKVCSNMRQMQKEWYDKHNSWEDQICKKNCLDVCVAYNNKYAEYHKNSS